MGTGNLAPDHPDLGAADLLLALVDVGNLLAEVEATFVLARSVLAAFLRSRNVLGSLSVVDTLDLDQAGAGRLVVSATLVAQVTSPDVARLALRPEAIGSCVRLWCVVVAAPPNPQSHHSPPTAGQI